MKTHILLFGILALAILPLRSDDGSKVVAGEKKLAPAITKADSEDWKPDWLTELSLTFRESYDSNVYDSNVPPLGNQDSMISTISPKIDINFVPMIGDKDAGLEKLTLCYNPVISYYHAETGENNTAHNIGNLIKGKAGDFSYDLSNLFTVVDGNTTALAYPNGFNFYSATVTRNRRSQIDEVGKLSLRYDLNKEWFVRTVAQTFYQDYGTRLMSMVPGYLNYIDRFDVNVGPDVGYHFTKDFAVTLGYRAGHQGQSIFGNNQGPTGSGGSDNNNYQRVLVGLEGKPWPWLKLEISAGPDFRHYGNDIPTDSAVNEDRNFNRIFCDSKMTFLLTRDDTLSFMVKQWQWISSVSVATYQDETYRMGYKRQWTKDFSSEIFIQHAEADFDSYGPPGRDDSMDTVGTTLVYQLNKHVTMDLGYSVDRGGSAYMPGATQPVGRDFTCHLVTFGTAYKF